MLLNTQLTLSKHFAIVSRIIMLDCEASCSFSAEKAD